MKATQRDFATIAPGAVAKARVFLFCGADEAGAQDAARTIIARLPDAGERVDLAGADLRKDPVRLGDEARSTSLFGASRHIVAHVNGDEAFAAVETLLAGSVPPCPVLIVAAGASDKSRTAKLLADRADALVAVFHAPDLASVATAVRGMADAAGLRITGDIAERLARAANLDTRVVRTEIAKIALYLDAAPERPRTADAATLEAIGASAQEDDLSALVAVVLGGQVARLPGELCRLREGGLNAVSVALACERRAAQLAGLAARLRPGQDVRGFVRGEVAARRVFFRDEAELAAQLARWRSGALGALVRRLMALHARMLADNHNADLLLANQLTVIARMAARRGDPLKAFSGLR